jgi:hypothetical protein
MTDNFKTQFGVSPVPGGSRDRGSLRTAYTGKTTMDFSLTPFVGAEAEPVPQPPRRNGRRLRRSANPGNLWGGGLLDMCNHQQTRY